MKKVILTTVLCSLVTLYAADAVKPTPTEGPGKKTQVEKNVVKVEKVEKKSEKQVKKEAHRAADKL
ncbi:MAG: hypothetical protein PHW18_06860 [Sulfuricurvum sp.]|uniref:hypothetical protein n=1 Tax=Sulfuricurvum sp. TaxID=2025608 RepID=UPI0026253E7D|nr:hypothetical protein [Sulfuricurvum sp.]MDD2829279.1 hypothetical protein [Sulfuricurvum sp.]MDD4949957.1 hypothetical protein [Sulfuricurvum sp.]